MEVSVLTKISIYLKKKTFIVIIITNTVNTVFHIKK